MTPKRCQRTVSNLDHSPSSFSAELMLSVNFYTAMTLRQEKTTSQS